MLIDREQFDEEWLSAIDPTEGKRRHYELRAGTFWIRHQIAHFVNPRTIVELGVRSGYSAWAMLKAVPDAHYFGYDNYDPDYESAHGENLSKAFKVWAQKLLADFPNASIVVQDVYEEDFVPPLAKLYHIDADHRYLYEKRDILNCVRAGSVESVFLVHDFSTRCVRRAVMDAAGESGLSVYEILKSNNGDAVLVHGAAPDWVFSVGGGACLIAGGV